jgi:hypothetical protein
MYKKTNLLFFNLNIMDDLCSPILSTLDSELLPHLIPERVHSSINNTGAYTIRVCGQNENFLQPLACTSSLFATSAAHLEGEI